MKPEMKGPSWQTGSNLNGVNAMTNHTVPTDEPQEIHDEAHGFESVKSILPRAISHLFSQKELEAPSSTLVSV
jgi:hypothetical protein